MSDGTHPNLTPYQGHDVVSATVSIRNTGDGLSKALSVEPVELEVGSKVYVLLECEVEKHRHEPENKDVYDRLVLVNMLKAGRATMVSHGVASKHLNAQQRKIEEAEGVHRLPGTEEED